MIYFVIGVLVLLGGFLSWFLSGSKKTVEARTKKLNLMLYRFFSRNFITQFYLRSLEKKLMNLSIYKREEASLLASQYLLISWGLGGVILAIVFFVFNDMISVLIALAFVVFFITVFVDKRLDWLQSLVLYHFGNMLSTVRQEYMSTDSVVEAIEKAEVHDMLKKVKDDILSMLTSVNGDLKLQEFCESNPFRPIQTFAAICYQINNFGDERDEHGQSNFMQSLTTMLGDLNAEVEKILYRKKKFGFIEYLPLAPLFGVGLVENFFVNVIPGTALVYNSPLGYFFKVLTLVLSIIIYIIISRANSNIPYKEDDRSKWVRFLLERKGFKKFILTLVPKGKRKMRLHYKLKKALSRMDLEEFYAKKFIFGVFGIIFGVVVTFSTLNLVENFLWTSTQQLSLSDTGEMEKFEKEKIQELDRIYLTNPEKYANDDALKALILQYMPSLSDFQTVDQINRLKSKKEALDNLYFKWWYVWLIFLVGVLAWFLPNMAIKVRGMFVKTEEEDDFLQIQTLVSILMNTNIDTLELLNQLSQHSRVHKDMFLYAYQGYASDPEMIIEWLQTQTTIVPFKRFLGKLKLTINDLSLREAFSDLVIEREHIMKLRNMAVMQSIDKKRTICGFLALVPLGGLILGSFLIPIGVLGYHEFTKSLSNIM